MNERRPLDFYVGYEPRMPRGHAGAVRRAVFAAAACSLAIAGIALAAQRSLPDARFEFGRFREYVGLVAIDPYPRLVMPEGTEPPSYLLVSPGKHGAEGVMREWSDRHVRLQAAVIQRGGQAMLELRPGSIRVSESATRPADRRAGRERGVVTLRGEIVDSKCFLGVMNPSEGSVHRDCAVACLRGGLPPMLRTRNAIGQEAVLLLVTSEGATASRELAGLAGRSVELTGTLVRDSGGHVLRVHAVRLLS